MLFFGDPASPFFSLLYFQLLSPCLWIIPLNYYSNFKTLQNQSLIPDVKAIFAKDKTVQSGWQLANPDVLE